MTVEITHGWRIPDSDIRTDYLPERNDAGEVVRHTVKVTHLPTGKSVVEKSYPSQLQNYDSARSVLESWVLDPKIRTQPESITETLTRERERVLDYMTRLSMMGELWRVHENYSFGRREYFVLRPSGECVMTTSERDVAQVFSALPGIFSRYEFMLNELIIQEQEEEEHA